MAQDFFKTILKSTKNQFATIAEDGIVAGDIDGYLHSGSLYLNALLSGYTSRGFPKGKVTALAGEPGSGKTFILMSAMKEFLDANKDGCVFLFESESAISKDMLVGRGIDVSRVLVFPVITIEQFKFQVVSILDAYEKEAKKRPILMALDSLGNLSTSKEVTDAADGKETRDMTRAQVIKATFRIITLRLGFLNIPMIVTNHIYTTMGLFASKEMGGGSGLKYCASTIIFLSKRQDVKGHSVIVTGTVAKGRLTREKSQAEIFIDFRKGLSRYWGMLEVGLECGAITKQGNSYLYGDEKIGASKAKAYANLDKFVTNADLMEKIDTFLNEKYAYGVSDGTDVIIPDMGDDDDDEVDANG